MYDVVQQLEALLIEYGPSNVTIGNFMYQAELDAFFRDGREADFSAAPNVLDSLVHLDHTYYQYETEIDFPGLHIDCDSADEEDLDDTLPYEEPPPPIIQLEIDRITQILKLSKVSFMLQQVDNLC